MRITFIIPTLDEAAYLSRCVDSIRGLTRPPDVTSTQIVVVDTGSTDDTTAIAAALGVSIVQVQGATVAAARNRGARTVDGDLLAFVDADCELPRDWLLYGLEHLRRPGVGATGTSLADPSAAATWVERHWRRVGYATPHAHYEPARWLPTCNLLIWRESFEAAGGFNETLITCEDCDFGYRLAAAGYQLIAENRIRARHSRESRTLVELFKRERWRGLGNLQSWRLHGWDRREFWSAAGPMLFVAMTATILLTIALATRNRGPLIIAVELVGLSLIPCFMLLRRGVAPHRGLSAFVCSYILVCVYLSARGLAAISLRKTIDPVAVTKVQWDSRT